jgi:DNA-binding NarL/FixJ family response regulator
MSPRLRLALALVALATGLVNLALVLGAGDARPRPPLPYLLVAIIGVSWSFVAAGLLAWSRRPENRTGALMVAVGLASALPGLRLVGTPLGFTLDLLLATLPAAVLAHLIAVFPDGRATTRLQRVFIVANYATTVPLAFVQLLLVDPGLLGCAECPNDLLGTGGRHPYGEAVVALSNLWQVVLAGLLLWIVVTRWRRAAPPRRRSLAPVAQVAVVLLVLFIVRQTLRAAMSSPPPWIDVGLDLAVLTTLMLWPLGFLAGLARTRLDRSAVGDLAIELDQAWSPGRLEQALARVLHDPTVQLAYWLPDRQAFVDAAGRPVELPPAGGNRGVTVLRHDGDPVAALLHDPALDDDPQLVQAVAATARLAIENQRLQAEVRAQLEEVRASRARIVAFGDAERRRVERNLHDGAQQRLVNLAHPRHRPLAAGGRLRWGAGGGAGRGGRRTSARAHGAARAGARHPPGDPQRGRPGPGAGVAGRALAHPRHRHRSPTRPASRPGRGDRLLRRVRSARQRRQTRPRHRGHHQRPALRTRPRSGNRRRRRRRRRPRRLGTARPGRPCCRRRWPPRGAQPGRPGHLDHRGAAMRVVIADDAVLFREGLAKVLQAAGIQVAAQVGDAEQLLARVRADPPAAVVVDIRMPPTHTREGLDAAQRIRATHPKVGVLVLSQYAEPHHAMQLLEDGASGVGYLLKDRVTDVAEVVDAVRRVAGGGSVIDPEVVTQLVSRRRARDPIQELSERERQVLALMAEGRSNQAVGERLFLSPKTVEAHVRSIFTRLDLHAAPDDHRRVLAVLAFLRA